MSKEKKKQKEDQDTVQDTVEEQSTEDTEDQIQEEDQEETEEEKPKKKIIDIESKPTKKSRKGAKRLDIKDSAQLFKQEVNIHLIDPDINLDDYTDLSNDEGILNIKDLPDECVYEFTCRFIDPGTLQELANTPFTMEISNSADLTNEELGEQYRQMQIKKLTNSSTEFELKYAVIHACVIDPAFESPEEVKQVLPVSWINELYFEITRGAVGENLRARFRDPSRGK